MPKMQAYKMGPQIGLALVATLLLCGCSDIVKASSPVSEVQRFIPSRHNERFALDTKTGRLCRTWNWFTGNEDPDFDYYNFPVCSNLYKDPATKSPKEIADASGTTLDFIPDHSKGQNK